MVKDRISGKYTFSLQMTGPYEGKNPFYGTWDPIMYDNSADHIKISKIEIVYMDGTKATVSGKDLIDFGGDSSWIL